MLADILSLSIAVSSALSATSVTFGDLRLSFADGLAGQKACLSGLETLAAAVFLRAFAMGVRK
jgi:hypothetical protein